MRYASPRCFFGPLLLSVFLLRYFPSIYLCKQLGETILCACIDQHLSHFYVDCYACKIIIKPYSYHRISIPSRIIWQSVCQYLKAFIMRTILVARWMDQFWLPFRSILRMSIKIQPKGLFRGSIISNLTEIPPIIR